jgi:hypothetical protein
MTNGGPAERLLGSPISSSSNGYYFRQLLQLSFRAIQEPGKWAVGTPAPTKCRRNGPPYPLIKTLDGIVSRQAQIVILKNVVYFLCGSSVLKAALQ